MTSERYDEILNGAEPEMHEVTDFVQQTRDNIQVLSSELEILEEDLERADAEKEQLLCQIENLEYELLDARDALCCGDDE
jgi:chromosome segregation ATPase